MDKEISVFPQDLAKKKQQPMVSDAVFMWGYVLVTNYKANKQEERGVKSVSHSYDVSANQQKGEEQTDLFILHVGGKHKLNVWIPRIYYATW